MLLVCCWRTIKEISLLFSCPTGLNLLKIKIYTSIIVHVVCNYLMELVKVYLMLMNNLFNQVNLNKDDEVLIILQINMMIINDSIDERLRK